LGSTYTVEIVIILLAITIFQAYTQIHELIDCLLIHFYKSILLIETCELLYVQDMSLNRNK